MKAKYCPYCDKTQIRCSDPPACMMGEDSCSNAQAMWNAEKHIEELETKCINQARLLKMQASAEDKVYLRRRVKELEAVLEDALACAQKGNALGVESVIETGWHGE